MDETRIRLAFGYHRGLPPDRTVAWGARLIVTQDGEVDLVHDRQGAIGAAEPCDRLLRQTRVEREHLVLADDVLVIKANTNASAGYCYVVAYFALVADEGVRPLNGDARVHRPMDQAGDHQLVADLIGPAVMRQVAGVPVTQLLDATDDQLASWGLPGPARRRLLAAAELARRFQPATSPPTSFSKPLDLLPHLRFLRRCPVEVLGLFSFDSRLALIEPFRLIAGGAVMHVSVSPREVFAPAIAAGACSIVLAHNHPSGDPQPSRDDCTFTESMVRAGRLLGIGVIDHLVVARRSWVSFASAGLL